MFLIVSFSFQEKKNLKTNKTAPFNIRDSTRSKVDNDNVILNVKSEISTKIKVITTELALGGRLKPANCTKHVFKQL